MSLAGSLAGSLAAFPCCTPRAQGVCSGSSLCVERGGGLGGCDRYDHSRRPLHSMPNAWAIWRIVVRTRRFAVICAAGVRLVSGDGWWLRHIG
ncbi:hypothetical protein [Azospirillum largimobile]